MSTSSETSPPSSRAARRRVVINGRFTGRRVTGVERYAGEIVGAIDRLVAEGHPATDGLDIVLAVPHTTECRLPLATIPVVRTGRWSGYAWEQFELPRFAAGDTIVNLCNLAPVAFGRSITCIHDAHVWLVPENYSTAFKLAYKVLQPASLRRSARWTTVSRWSGEQLVSLGVAPRGPDAVTPNGADHVLRWSAERATIDRARLPERFVLALGSRSPNKNFGLVRGLAEVMAPRGLAVVIAGGGNDRVFMANSATAADAVTELGHVTDDDLALLFSRARCFLFPSLQEGFGLPPVEAMRLGCPVVASNTAAMPEVLGDAAVLCDPKRLDEWVEAVERVCTDDVFRARLVMQGHARAARYTWRSSALEMLRLIQQEALGEVR